jgi:riboflavin biosynthesis pyrimidine reductase
MRCLHPEPIEHITASQAYDVPRPRPAGRPWLGLCMVASIDGSTVVDHRSSALSSDADRKPGQRIGVVSRSGRIDLSMPLFTSGAGFLIVPRSAPELAIETVRAGDDDVDLVAALSQLDADFVQAEGGPALNAALAEVDVIDELNLTISPMLSGGDGPRLMTGAEPLGHRLQLAHVLEDDGFLFTRYVRSRT